MPAIKTEPSQVLANFLRRQREQLGLTQAAMAERITGQGYPMTPETLSRMERTGVVPALKDTRATNAMGRAYNVPPIALWKLAKLYPPPDGVTDDSEASALPPDLLEILERASPEQLKLITKLARQVVDE